MQNVAIFGVPRSGTSWLGQIFNSSPNVIYRYQPIFAYSFEDTLSANSSSKDIRGFHKNLLATDDDFVCQKKNVSANDAPQFSKGKTTHLVWKEVRYLNIIEDLIQQSSIKIIGIVRHPCGVLKSWMKAPKEFNKEWDIVEEWRYAQKKNEEKNDFYGYERWIRATQMFTELEKSYPNKFKTVVYESLLKEPNLITKEMFSFAGLRYTHQTKSFLQKSTQTASDDPYDVFRKEKTGQEWKNELPSDIINKILSDERFKELNKYFKWDEILK
jgi:hypothetical protein